MMSYAILVALIGVIIVVAAYYVARRREVVNDLTAWQNMTRPIIIHSHAPGDTTVRQRYEHAKAMLEESGNQWSLPVYMFAYRDVANGGDMHEHWNDYLVRLGEFVRLKDNDFAHFVNKSDRGAYERFGLKMN